MLNNETDSQCCVLTTLPWEAVSYIISELMDTDLHRIIISGQTLAASHVQLFVYQILRGLSVVMLLQSETLPSLNISTLLQQHTRTVFIGLGYIYLRGCARCILSTPLSFRQPTFTLHINRQYDQMGLTDQFIGLIICDKSISCQCLLPILYNRIRQIQ